MTKEKLFLLDVLKSFIHEEKLNFNAELDWGKVMMLSQIHSVTGILGYMSMQSPCKCDEQMSDALKKQCFANIAVFAQRSQKAQKITAMLNEAGVDHMLFKGGIVRDYYPVPELRSFGDVDILIKPGDRKKCHELMLNEGFAVKTDWEPVYCYYKGAEVYELHTEIMEVDVSDKADYRGYFNTAWEHVKNIGGHTFEPTPEFHFLYLLTHIAKHIRGAGAGIRMYLDLAAFIKHFGDSIDWTYIDNTLEALKLKDFANTALTLVEKYFGVKSPIELRAVSDETLEAFIDFTLDGGIFGQVGRDSGLVTLKKANDKSRIATVMRRAFPKAETIESRYTYLQGKHWLLPVAWVHRVFKNRNIWSQRANEVKRIMQIDDAEVEKLKSLYKEIGL